LLHQEWQGNDEAGREQEKQGVAVIVASWKLCVLSKRQKSIADLANCGPAGLQQEPSQGFQIFQGKLTIRIFYMKFLFFFFLLNFVK
jgi:hypothetical protein